MRSIPPADPAAALLEVEGLAVDFPSDDGPVHAVRGVSFALAPGEILGIVGESGCGKSVTARALLRLIDAPGEVVAGSVRYRGHDLLLATPSQLAEIRGGEISMVFQDPMTSLNPVLTVGHQIAAVMEPHQQLSRDQRDARIRELLDAVGISDPDRRAHQYPHELSGGMRQRVMIAMALANDPAIIVADEPTTALDVTIQAQILDLLRTINRDSQTAIAFITHNLGVVAELCQRVAVFYAGRVVESGPTERVFADPRHPYTRALLGSLPVPGERRRRLTPVAGAPPLVIGDHSGCAFAPRCPLRVDRCEQDPRLEPLAPGHAAACWVAQADEIPAAGGPG